MERTRPGPARGSAPPRPPASSACGKAPSPSWSPRVCCPKAVKWQRHGLDRADEESLALERYTPGHPWFTTNREAAQILGISRERVKQLVDTGRLPCVEYRGRRYFR